MNLKHVIPFYESKMNEQDTICGYREYCDYKISSIPFNYKMIEQYTTCNDTIEPSKLLRYMPSVGLACSKSLIESLFAFSLYDIKLSECKFSMRFQD